MITYTKSPAPSPWRPWRRPKIIAAFSFRYDAHLVSDLIANITPMVDGWVAFDDRQSTDVFSDEPARRRNLVAAAISQGADWILAVDPDERLEQCAAARLRKLVKSGAGTAWSFRLREMYTPSSYRIDGCWQHKRLARLFPASRSLQVEAGALHGHWFERGSLAVKNSGLNLYHLKMIAPMRRAGRRDLYNHLDPHRKFQDIGYDYLADESGAQFEEIPPGRGYHPLHIDDGGLWMAPVPANEAG